MLELTWYRQCKHCYICDDVGHRNANEERVIRHGAVRRLITIPEARDWVALEYSDQDLDYEIAMISSDRCVSKTLEDRTYDSNPPRCDKSHK